MDIIPDYGDPREPIVRAKYAYLEAAMSIIGNIVLAILKIFIGLLINSVSIMADAVHTLSDVASSGVVIAGITAAKKEPDEEHPFGHGRYEYIATLVISIGLILVAAELFLESVDKFYHPTQMDIEGHVILVYSIMLVSIIAKEAMARYGMFLGKKTNSKMLEADAWHHRADAVTTIGVIVALIFVQLDFPPGYGHLADPILGIIISIYIGYEAAKLAKDSMDLLAGKRGESDKVELIVGAAKKVDGVVDVHDVYVHDYGNRCILSLHVTVDDDITTRLSHKIASVVEAEVEKVFPCEVVVHIEPSGKECARSIERALVQILKATPEIVNYHSVRSSKDEEGGYIAVHARVNRDMSVDASHKLVHDIDAKLKESYLDYRLDIHVEPCDKACDDCSSEQVCEASSKEN